MAKYRVVIPYFHEFHVEANSGMEALEKAHSADGTIIGYDDSEAVIEKE